MVPLKPGDEAVHPASPGAEVDIPGLEPKDPEIVCKEVPQHTGSGENPVQNCSRRSPAARLGVGLDDF